MTDARAALLARVAAARRAMVLDRVARVGAIALGGAALAVQAGAPLWTIAVGVGTALIAAGLPPTPVRAAAQLDVAAGLAGEIECAFDHRDRADAMSTGQRRLAVRHLTERAPLRVVPRAHPIWLLPLALWVWPLTQGDAAIGAGEGLRAEAPEASLAADGGAGQAGTAAADSVADAGARAALAPSEDPDAGANGDGGAGADPTAEANRGGVGAQAGVREAGAAGREAAGREAVGEALTFERALGAGEAGDGPAGRAIVGRTPPPPDAIADPARPYPPRYHAVISAWFDRERR